MLYTIHAVVTLHRFIGQSGVKKSRSGPSSSIILSFCFCICVTFPVLCIAKQYIRPRRNYVPITRSYFNALFVFRADVDPAAPGNRLERVT